MPSLNDSTFKDFLYSLGLGNRLPTIISSIALGLCFFFYVYAVGSFFHITVGTLQDRIVYIGPFQSHIFSEYIDYSIIISATVVWLILSIKGRTRFVISALYSACAIVGAMLEPSSIVLDVTVLASIPIILGLLLVLHRLASYKNQIGATGVLTISYASLIGILLGIATITVTSLSALLAVQLESMPIRLYAFEIFTLLSSSLSPFFMVLLIFGLPVKLLLNEFSSMQIKKESDNFSKIFRLHVLNSRKRIIFLVLIIMMCIVLVLIPHQPTINKDGQRIGVDTHYYVNWTSSVAKANSFQEAVGQAFIINGGDRPMTLLLLHSLVKFVDANSAAITIEYVPLILGPLLIIVTYFLTRELTSGNEITALFAAFLTSVSFQVLVGVFAGFYANWIAITFGYASFVFLFRFVKKNNKANFIAFTILFILVLLSHVYTWTILALVTTLVLVVMLKLDYYEKRRMYLLLLSVFACVVIDLIRAAITNTPPGIQYQIDNSIRIINERDQGSFTENFSSRWDNLMELHRTYSAMFSNFIVTGLGVFWLLLSKLHNSSTILMIVFLSVAVLPLFIGDWLLQSRFIYEIPFQIPAALALTHIYKSSKGKMALWAICIWLVAISLYDLSNLYFVDRST